MCTLVPRFESKRLIAEDLEANFDPSSPGRDEPFGSPQKPSHAYQKPSHAHHKTSHAHHKNSETTLSDLSQSNISSVPPPAPSGFSGTIALCYPVENHHLARYSNAFPDAHIVNAGQEGIATAIGSADVFVGHAKVPVDWETTVRNGQLKFIQSSAAGLDHCLTPPVIASEIRVASASGLFAQQVAEQTMSLLFGLIRSAPVFFHQQSKKQYVRRPTDDLCGKRIGIVGLGGNGRRIAELLKPFGVEIHAVDAYPTDQPDCVSTLRSPDHLLDLASQSDVLLLCTPLNDNTFHLIDQRVFSAMPRGSYFVNVARGQCVKETDLVAALLPDKDDPPQLAGAGIDVAEVEPLPADSPLWELPNVIITPHVGAQSANRVDDSTRLACENIRRWHAGETIINEVSKNLGFPTPDLLARNYKY